MARDIRSGFTITELVVLSLIAERDMYGLEIAKAVGALISGGQVQCGVVYPLLKDCQREGLISQYTKPRVGRAPIKFYFLTEAGKVLLKAIANNWHEVNTSVVSLLQRTSTSLDAVDGPAPGRRILGDQSESSSDY